MISGYEDSIQELLLGMKRRYEKATAYPLLLHDSLDCEPPSSSSAKVIGHGRISYNNMSSGSNK